jgi:hypothetical protein
MKFAADFNSFLRTEVNLNRSRLDLLQDRVDAVESYVAASETFVDSFLEVIPTGSWAHKTIIRPVGETDGFDADVLVHIKEESAWSPRDYINELYTSLRASATYREMVSRKTRCVRVTYANEFHIDLVPYVERHGQFYITNRHEPEGVGCFELSAPERFTDWVDGLQVTTSGNFVKAVRLAKYLRDFKKTFACKSIILKTLLGNQVNETEAMVFPELYTDVPSTLNTLFQKLAQSLPEEMPAVLDPADTGDNFTDRYGDSWNYANFRDRIRYYAEKILAAYEETDRETAINLWQEIFGTGFKPGELKSVASLSPLNASIPWEKEEFIEDKFEIALDPTVRLKVRARCTGLVSGQVSRRNGFRQFDLNSRGNRVAKNRSLRFEADISSPVPYELYWKVKNGGEEAASVIGLRGEIRPDGGQRVKVESTSYKGSHFVECYAVADGKVIARTRQPVVVV